MAKKQTQLEKAIAAIDADIAVLQAAKARLIKEQAATPKRKPRSSVVAAEPELLHR